MVELLDDDAETTLDGSISNSSTTLDIVTVAGSPTNADAPFRIWIDDEICLVTSVSGNTYYLIRGVEGSLAASHSNGTSIFYPQSSGVHVQLEVEIARLRGLIGNAPGAGYWTILANGVVATPEIIFADGDVISIFVP